MIGSHADDKVISQERPHRKKQQFTHGAHPLHYVVIKTSRVLNVYTWQIAYNCWILIVTSNKIVQNLIWVSFWSLCLNLGHPLYTCFVVAISYKVPTNRNTHQRCLNSISKGSGVWLIPIFPVNFGEGVSLGQIKSKRCNNATKNRKSSISASDLPKHIRGPEM